MPKNRTTFSGESRESSLEFYSHFRYLYN